MELIEVRHHVRPALILLRNSLSLVVDRVALGRRVVQDHPPAVAVLRHEAKRMNEEVWPRR